MKKYENIDTPEFFKKWQQERKVNKPKQKEAEDDKSIIYYLGIGLVTFLSIVGMLTIIYLIEMI